MNLQLNHLPKSSVSDPLHFLQRLGLAFSVTQGIKIPWPNSTDLIFQIAVRYTICTWCHVCMELN